MSDPDDAVDTSRTVVKTYVPAYQKAEWRAHADELDMTQSEFVRTMVQAGRRGFSLDRPEAGSPDADPRGDGLEDRVLARLSEGPHSWDELLESLTGGMEDRLDEILGELQDRNRVRYSGRDGGYVVVGGGDE